MEEFQNTERRELLDSDTLSDSSSNQREENEEVTNDVPANASEQVPYNEFSRALAVEVRVLLGEFDKMREERRIIQHELEYLITIKSKYDPGGEFFAQRDAEREVPGPMLPSPPPDVPPPPRLPAWRRVQQRTRIRKQRQEAPPDPTPEPSKVPSGATWQPNPAWTPSPPPVEPILLTSDRESPGLFGPHSPDRSNVAGDTCEHDPTLPPISPIVEPILFDRDRGSPGLPDIPSPERKKASLDSLDSLGTEDSWGAWNDPPSPPTHPRASVRFESQSPDQWVARQPYPPSPPTHPRASDGFEFERRSSDQSVTWQPDPALAPMTTEPVPLQVPHSSSPETTELHTQQPELLNFLSDGWAAYRPYSGQRGGSMNGARTIANEQYLYEFSKALANEVRLLLVKVDEVYEERRTIQQALGQLMVAKSAYGPGGTYIPQWSRPALPGPRRSESRDVPAWRTWWNATTDPESPGLFGPRSPRDSLYG